MNEIQESLTRCQAILNDVSELLAFQRQQIQAIKELAERSR